MALVPLGVLAQTTSHWETLVQDNVQWRYRIPTTLVNATWKNITYNDAAWSIGTGGIGYGDGDDSTDIANTTTSVYMRHTFQIVDASDIVELRLAVDYDDAYVAYLNGVEVSRRNIGTVGTLVPFSDLAFDQHEATLYQGFAPDINVIDPALLTTGTNVLAVQIHNQFSGSSDLTGRPFLIAGIASSAINYSPTPDWFVTPTLLISELPIVVLNTLNQEIMDDPRIVIEMGIIDNGAGNLNTETDPFNAYNGLISIEVRGSSSQGFPKKQYALETQDALGNSLDVPLLGLPVENDWILHAPFSDKTLMRNYLTYNWWREMGWYTTRTRYCEVILNGEYQGIYLLFEQIKWDNDRVDIEKMDTNDNAGDSLTGGYIFKVDKTTGSGQYDWGSHVVDFQGQPKNVPYQYDYPNRDSITTEQENYLQQFVYDWEQALIDPTFMDAEVGYRKYMDVNSFIDFFLIQEITKNVDGYRLSNYLNKQRDSRGGKLQAGPAWDFNITLGNADYCGGGETDGWALDFPCDPSVIPFWWHRMQQDPVYQNQVQCRWAELRTGFLSNDSIDAKIDSTVQLLGTAVDRNFVRWPVFGTYVWPNNFIGNTYQEEIDYLKSWMSQRVAWLDANIGSPANACESAFQPDVTVSEINYNSANNLDTDDWFELQNLTSIPLDISFWTLKDGNEFNTFTFPMGTSILPDSFLVVMANTALFSAIRPEVTNRVGQFNWGMGNGGDSFTLHDFENNLVLSMAFDDQAPWPLAPDGNSETLEKWDWATDLNDPASWRAGCSAGSPGRSYTTCLFVGTETPNAEANFGLFPNPASNQCWVALDKPATVWIYNSVGQQMLSQAVQAGTSSIAINTLSEGLYIIRAETADGERFAKQLVIY